MSGIVTALKTNASKVMRTTATFMNHWLVWSFRYAGSFMMARKGTTITGTWGLGRLGCPMRANLIADIRQAASH